jgi:hypothetical protein
MMEAIHYSEISVLTKEPHGATSKKAAFFIVTAIKTSNLTYFSLDCSSTLTYTTDIYSGPHI